MSLLGAINMTLDGLRYRLERGADLEEVDEHGLRPLGYLLMYTYWYPNGFDVCKFLVEAGADVNAPIGNEYASALDCIVGSNKSWGPDTPESCVVRLFIDAGADPNVHSGAPLLHGVRDVECMEILIGAGADVHDRDKRQRTALHHAVTRRNNMECVRALLAAGVDPNAVDEDGNTSLHYACLSNTEGAIYSIGDVDPIVRCLIEGGADVHARNKRGKRPVDANDIPIEAAVALVENGAFFNGGNNRLKAARRVYLDGLRERMGVFVLGKPFPDDVMRLVAGHIHSLLPPQNKA